MEPPTPLELVLTRVVPAAAWHADRDGAERDLNAALARLAAARGAADPVHGEVRVEVLEEVERVRLTLTATAFTAPPALPGAEGSAPGS